MTQSPITVTYSLEEILSRIEGKIDDLRKDVDSRFDSLPVGRLLTFDN